MTYYIKMSKTITLESYYLVSDEKDLELVYASEMPMCERVHITGLQLGTAFVCGPHAMEACGIKLKVTNQNRKAGDLIYNIGRKIIFDHRHPQSVEQYGEECLFIFLDRTKYYDYSIYSPNYKGCDVKYDKDINVFKLKFN